MPTMIENDAPNIEPSTYNLEITKVKLVDVKDFNDPDTIVKKLQVSFVVVDNEEWGGVEFDDLFALNDGPKSKLGRLARAAFNIAKLESPWDADELKRRRVRAGVRLRDSGYNGIDHENISPYKPPAAGGRRNPKAAAAPPPESESDEYGDPVGAAVGANEFLPPPPA